MATHGNPTADTRVLEIDYEKRTIDDRHARMRNGVIVDLRRRRVLLGVWNGLELQRGQHGRAGPDGDKRCIRWSDDHLRGRVLLVGYVDRSEQQQGRYVARSGCCANHSYGDECTDYLYGHAQR